MFKKLLGKNKPAQPETEVGRDRNDQRLGDITPSSVRRRQELDALARHNRDYEEMMRKQQMATATAGMADMRDGLNGWPSVSSQDAWSTRAQNAMPAKQKEKGWPLEDIPTEDLSKILDTASAPMREKLLGDMCLSNSQHQRMFAVLHEETPIVSITMHLQADKDERVRYLAQCRVETDDTSRDT